jgi:RNA polymerase sigma-70 factor (ECF subfamily)
MDEPREFENLVAEQLDSLWRYALALTRHTDSADDLVQDSLARAFERFHLFDRSLSFKAWMFTIIRHAYVDQLRKRRARIREAPSDWPFRGPESDLAHESLLCAIPLDPEAILSRLESVVRVRAAIEHLPGELREVVQLRDIEGLSYREIAAVLSCPVGTVMSRLYRGRNLLRTCLAEAPTEEPKAVETQRGL